MDICAASNYSSPVCNQIIRPLGAANPDPNNGPTAVLINLRNFKTGGIDFELRYQLPIGSGKLTVESLATRLLSSKQQNAPGQAVFNFLGNADMTDGNPIIPTSTSPGLAYPTLRSAYDIIGTYVTIGARLKM
ncbi:hypothetical protein SAMN05444678_11964 [Sphingomonas sp. YR710]|uniref:hypothetical protein n=1 Tax=Sphingomonas sp. YR710 TaxID=1882773 RepID=UPI00087E7428|nr:hypothetical protein [Sphingomonas sp. YR710]SDD70206.1 hypothetical protein SAMN05444678_11964 [Sphingomonas sp. YR710]